MTTFVSLASSATMFPASGMIRCSMLTPELVKARLAYPDLVVSALNPSHATTIDAIKRRYGLELPLPVIAPGERAPQITLKPGDELFIVQASLPRLKEGEVHSDETVQAASISFLRWRVPVSVEVKAPRSVPQCIFNEIIDHAHSIALWRRGQRQLNESDALIVNFNNEVDEYHTAWSNWVNCDFSKGDKKSDIYLEWADVAYYALCLYYVSGGDFDASWRRALGYADECLDIDSGLDVMLAKYGRRATGAPKDLDVERELAASILA